MKRKRMTALALCAALAVTAAPSTLAFAAGSSGQDIYHVNTNGELTGYEGNGYVEVPEDVDGMAITKVKENAFKGVKNITAFDSGHAKVIGDYAFENSGLNYVHIHSDVKQIGMYAFANCSELATVVYEPKDCVLGALAFGNTNSVLFKIPCSSDISKALEDIKEAKHDSNFTYELTHEYTKSSTIKEDDGTPALVCKDCGARYIDAEGDGYGDDYGYDEEMPFTDVAFDSWYHSYVKAAYEMGIINGKSATRFDPNANMTLAEAAKIAALVRKAQLEDHTAIEQTGKEWYSGYIDYCYSSGILEDYIRFDWNKPATRAQMAYIFARADVTGYQPNPDVPLTDIPDVHDTTPYAYEILDLYRKGIAAGSDAKLTFHPDANIKRSEVSAIVSRMLIADMRLDLPKG